MNTSISGTSFAITTNSTPGKRRTNETKAAGADREIVQSSRASEAFSARTPVAPETTDGSATPERLPRYRRKWASPIGTAVARLWRNWRHENEIRRAIQELATLDDRTLRDLGIRDRSEIEFMVRCCRRES
jgi:uncharacterized protein YjiS (DUF1127 family)